MQAKFIMNAIATENGVLIPVKSIKHIMHELEFTIKGFKNEWVEKSYSLITRRCPKTKNVKTYALVPRAWAIHNKFTVKRSKRLTAEHSLAVNWGKCPIEPKDDQKELTAMALKQLAEMKCTLLNLETGFGKTFIAIMILHKLSMKTLIVLPSNSIMNQTKKALLGIPELAYDITLIQSVGKYDLNKYGAIFIDEIHNIPSPSRVSLLFKATVVPYIIGASATITERNDGKDPLYLSHFSTAIITRSKGIKFRGKVHIIKYYNDEGGNDSKRIFELLNQQYMDDRRYEIVLSQLDKALTRHNGIFIYARAQAQARTLFEMAKRRHPTLADDMHLFTGEITAKERTNAEKNGNILFCTYSFASEGLSLVHMTALILADGKKTKLNQLFGRIARNSEMIPLTKLREVYCIIDAGTFMESYVHPIREEAKRRNWN